MVLAMVIVTIMLVFVFPAFEEMFANMGKELPWITRTLMDLGIFLKTNWLVIPVIFGAVIGTGIFVMKWPVTRKVIDDRCLKIPLLKQLTEYSNFSNFISVMQVAYEAGIPIIDCLYLSNVTFTNYTLKTKVQKAILKIQEGQHLSNALRTTKVVPKMILFMIATGEQSGRLGEMFNQAVIFIDKKLDAIVDTMTKLIEPIMLIVIGFIVMVLALALYLPLFGAYS